MLLSSLVSQQTALRSIHAFSLGSTFVKQASVVVGESFVTSTRRTTTESDLEIVEANSKMEENM